MRFTPEFVRSIRAEFPALARIVNERSAIYFDGPAGTQVPRSVIDAISRYLSHHNANHGGVFATSVESDRILEQTHQAAADFLGADDPSCVVFGANMTSLAFSLSRALGRTWRPEDEIVVTRLEHDANFTPWVLAARDAGATVRYVDIDPTDCTLDMDDFREKMSERTRFVAVGAASNAVGTVNAVARVCGWAREVGAISFVDAVHFAPHHLIDVTELGCDFLACSAYKFFGPHVGILWGKRELLERIEPSKLRPAPHDPPGRWMTGTQNHECLAGTLVAIDYLAGLGRKLSSDAPSRRAALTVAYRAIREYELALTDRLLAGLTANRSIRVFGITELSRRDQRLPTVAIMHDRLLPRQLAEYLAQQSIFVWHGNYYALPFTERMGLEPQGMTRIGLVHYNTTDEVDRLLESLTGV